MSIDKELRLATDGNSTTFAGFNQPVIFYSPKNTWGAFSNFSDHFVRLRHPFTGQPTAYATSEHRYQAMKATTQAEHDAIASAPTPKEAANMGRSLSVVRSGWNRGQKDGLAYMVMKEALTSKAAMHTGVRRSLGISRGRTIYEDSPRDNVWGWRLGDDYSGLNLLGEAWMDVREII